MGGDPRIGTELEGYLIEQLIGRGGMSVVYLAEHHRLKRKVALKLLSPELAENEEFRDRFVRESQLAAGIDHPNVIPVYDAGEADGVLYIAMRFVKGTDLRKVLREGPLDPAEAARVVEQVAAALDAAHAQGLVHRDVKPGNVLIAERTAPGGLGHPYLADFGLTKRALSVSGLTHTGQFVGTIDYVAPEQIKGDAVDDRADVYSLGCMTFECLTGRTPFSKDSEVASIYAHLMEPPPSAVETRPELPAEVDPVIARAMAKAPEDRYQSAGDLASELREALSPETSGEAGARPTARVLPTLLPRRRRKAAVIGGAVAAALAAVIVVTVVLVSGGNGKNPKGGRHLGAGLVPNVQGVAELDPRTGKVVAHMRIALGTGLAFHTGGHLAAGEGAVWIVGGPGGGFQLQKVDPRTAKVIDTIHPTTIGSGFVSPITIGDGRIWVLARFSASSGTLFRIDPATDRVTRTIDLPGVPNGFAIGAREVWVSYQNGNLSRIPFGSSRVAGSYTVGNAASGVAVADGQVWVADAVAGAVYRFDPVTHKVVQTVTLPGGADSIAAGEGGVWVADRAAGSVIRIDPSTGSTGSPIRVGSLPSAIATGAGAVWVADGGDGTVSRIDPVTYEVTTYRLTTPPSPFDIAVGEHGVWATLVGPAPGAHG